MKRNFIAILIISVLTHSVFAQTSQYTYPAQWYKNFNNVGLNKNQFKKHQATDIAYNVDGNVYVTGFLNGGIAQSYTCKIQVLKINPSGTQLAAVTYPVL